MIKLNRNIKNHEKIIRLLLDVIIINKVHPPTFGHFSFENPTKKYNRSVTIPSYLKGVFDEIVYSLIIQLSI